MNWSALSHIYIYKTITYVVTYIYIYIYHMHSKHCAEHFPHLISTLNCQEYTYSILASMNAVSIDVD